MPQCDHLKGHVTYYTIVLYYVEFSLITKSKWVREIVWSKFAIQISLLLAIIMRLTLRTIFSFILSCRELSILFAS